LHERTNLSEAPPSIALWLQRRGAAAAAAAAI
jgi:hypothetical protein